MEERREGPEDELRISGVRTRQQGKLRKRQVTLGPEEADSEMASMRGKRMADEASLEEGSAEASSSRRRENDDEVMAAFYANEQNRKVFEIEWELPQSRRGLKKFVANPEAYVDQRATS